MGAGAAVVRAAAFTVGCLATPLVLVLFALLLVVCGLLAAPLAAWRAATASGGPGATFRLEKKPRTGPYDLPYLRRAIRTVPALFIGPSALLVMICDPQVAMAVNAHSTYATAPVRRLFETIKLVYSLTVADPELQERAVTYISSKHDDIKGPGYSAQSKISQTWVWACLVKSIEEQFIICQPETKRVKQDHVDAFLTELYADWRQWGLNFGIPDRLLPQTRADFAVYYDETFTQFMPPSEASRELAAGLFSLSHLWFFLGLRPITWYFETLAIAFTPPKLQEHEPFNRPAGAGFVRWSFIFIWRNLPGFVRRVIFFIGAAAMDRAPFPTSHKVKKKSAENEPGATGSDSGNKLPVDIEAPAA